MALSGNGSRESCGLTGRSLENRPLAASWPPMRDGLNGPMDEIQTRTNCGLYGDSQSVSFVAVPKRSPALSTPPSQRTYGRFRPIVEYKFSNQDHRGIQFIQRRCAEE